MEEAAFMSPVMFSKIVVPLLGVDRTALLAISTPDVEDNYYTSLMNVQCNDGRPLFKVLRIGMACESCIAAGVPCSHKIFRLPFWKPIARQEKIDAIYKNNPELYAREILGQTVSNREYMVDAATLKKFREYPLYRFPDRVHIVHIGIDPSGGSTSSDYAICSTVRDNGHFVIIGCDISGSFKQDDILWMLDNHLLKIRQQPQYSNAFFMIYIEANMSWISADGLRTHFGKQPQLGQHLVYSRDPKKLGRPGVWTGESEKELYARGLRKMMHAGQLRYAENFISVGKKVHETKQILEDQLRQLRKETAASSGLEPGFDKVKTTYTGKSHGVRDDACMSLQIALYNMETVRQDPVFIQFCIQKSLAY